MNKFFTRTLTVLLLAISFQSTVLGQRLVDQIILPGVGYDNGISIFREDDGSFVLAGVTQSTDGVGEGNSTAGEEEVVIMKVSPTGMILWRTMLKGSGEEMLEQVKKTWDGGYSLVGTTASTDGDFKSNHGKYDIFLAKISSTGRKEWVRCYGGTGNDKGQCVENSYDDGFLLGGEVGSRNGDVRVPKGGLDAWFAKLDKEGKIIWTKSFGGTNNERTMDILEVPGRRTVVAIASLSDDGQVKDNLGKKDLWLLMLSRNYDIIWQKNFGGSDFDDITRMKLNHKDNLVLVGTTFSEDHDISQQFGYGDIWFLEVDLEGSMVMSRTYGGNKPDGASNILLTSDHGYLITGSSTSKTGHVGPSKGHYDGVALKLDSLGNLTWSATIGGEDYEAFEDAWELSDGDYMLFGWAESANGDLEGTGKDFGNDFWLARVSTLDDPPPLSFFPYILGYVRDFSKRNGLNAEITITDNSTLQPVYSLKTDEMNGSFQQILDAYMDKELSINFFVPGYMFYGENLPMDYLREKYQYPMSVNLKPIKVGAKIVLDNIYFDVGAWELKDESEPELRRLKFFLEQNPELVIEISGHTDNTGNVDHKKELSLRRAESVRDWLLKRNIPGRNMEVKGYGMEQPLASNDNETGRALNRRVEIKILDVR